MGRKHLAILSATILAFSVTICLFRISLSYGPYAPGTTRSLAFQSGCVIPAASRIVFSHGASPARLTPEFLVRVVWKPGFRWSFPLPSGYRNVAAPLGVASVLGLAWSLRKRSADTTVRCACGYPLKGLTGGRCPECGEVIQEL